MIRTLAYQVTLAGICPYAQKAGVQNENQATLINFVLAPELIKTKYKYRVEFVSKQGAFDTTGIIPLIDDTISINVVNGWTQTAGNHTLRVCISDEDGMDAYSYDCLMILEPRNTGTTNTPEEITTGLTELIAETTEAAQFANEQAESIQNMTVEAVELEYNTPPTVTKEIDPETGIVKLIYGLPKGELLPATPEVPETMFLNGNKQWSKIVLSTVDQTYTPESANAQSGTAVAKAVAVAIAKAQEIIDDVTEVNGGDFVWVE